MSLQKLSGDDLRTMREAKNLSIQDLSVMTGINTQTIVAAEGSYPGVAESIDMVTLKKWEGACSTSIIKRISLSVRRYIKQKLKA